MGHGLHTVQRQEGLAVQRLDRQTVRLLAADEKAVVLDLALGTGMGAARRDGERHAAEGEDLEIDIGAVGNDPLDRGEGQFRRQANGSGAPARQQPRGRRIVDVDQRSDIVRLAVQQPEGRKVVGLDQVIALLDQFPHLPAFPLQRDERQRREHHGLAGGLKPFGHFGEMRFDEMLALGAHGFADHHRVEGRFVGDAEMEVAPFGGVPQIVDGTHGKRRGKGFGHAHLQRFS